MTERYAFRYTEFLIGQKETDKVFADTSSENPLIADICARFKGAHFVNGKASLSALGIRIQKNDKSLQKVAEDVADYGADALRVATLENKLPLSHNQKAAGWRLADKLWLLLKEKDLSAPDNWLLKTFYPTIETLQNQDFKNAWFCLKTILNADHVPSGVAFGIYPFMPHLVQSIYPNIHSKMPTFWKFIQSIKLPPRYFIEINGKRICDFYPTYSSDFEKIKKEALSFLSVQNKINGKEIKNSIHILGKGINFVI